MNLRKVPKSEIDPSRRMQNKIENYFKRKPSSHLIMTLENKTKLRVEYMYGGMYCLKIKENKKKAQLLILVGESNKVVELIMREKKRASRRK